jgi:hypothetical protein
MLRATLALLASLTAGTAMAYPAKNLGMGDLAAMLRGGIVSARPPTDKELWEALQAASGKPSAPRSTSRQQKDATQELLEILQDLDRAPAKGPRIPTFHEWNR